MTEKSIKENIVIGKDFGKENDNITILSITGSTVLNLNDEDVDKKFEEILQNVRNEENDKEK